MARSRTTMHCPTCRHDNPATTRFCSACGAVLVESAPDGGRRRVLRPWGMRRTAPPTISPDMPDLADAGIPDPRHAPRSRRPLRFLDRRRTRRRLGRSGLDQRHGAAGPRCAARRRRAGWRGVGELHVSATTPTIVQEARLKAPPLVDVSPAASLRTEVTPRVVAPVEAAPPPVSDRWQPLRSALAQCGSVSATIARAMCEQEARLAHCDGFWGLVAACPTTRSEYGQ